MFERCVKGFVFDDGLKPLLGGLDFSASFLRISRLQAKGWLVRAAAKSK
jgi:hypothetical protein